MSYLPFKRLAPGALVAVVAPAGPADARRVADVPALIEAQGWRARTSATISSAVSGVFRHSACMI